MTHDWLSLANGVIPLVYWSNEVLANRVGVCEGKSGPAVDLGFLDLGLSLGLRDEHR